MSMACPKRLSRRSKGLQCWIVDALRYTPHPTHANVATALAWIARVKPTHAILTNLHLDLDYETLKARTA